MDDVDVVEQCLKALLKKKMYNKKEHYKISINDAVKTIYKCIKLTKNINEYGIEILFDINEIINKNILLGGMIEDNNILNYDDLFFINKIHNTIINLF